MSKQDLIHVGKISGVFGVKGWVKVFSYTDVREDILDYAPWLLKKANAIKNIDVVDGGLHGNAVIAKLDGIDDRDAAAALMGFDIFISPDQLPEPDEGEYYWSDLIGLSVVNQEGIELGKISSLMETGANDVVIIDGEKQHCIPFLQGHTILNIDLEKGLMLVDWDADF